MNKEKENDKQNQSEKKTIEAEIICFFAQSDANPLLRTLGISHKNTLRSLKKMRS